MEKIFLFLGFSLLFTTVSESRTIAPRALPKDGSSGHGEIPISLNPLEKDRRLKFGPGIRNQPEESDNVPAIDYEYEDANYRPPDYDFTKPAEGEVDTDSKRPGMAPDKYPSNVDHDGGPVGIPGTKDDERVDSTQHGVDKSYDDDDEFHGEEDSVGEESDSWHPVDEEEDKSIHGDEDEFHHGEDADGKEPEHGDDDDVNNHVPVDEEEDDKDTGEHVPEDKEEHVPDEEHEEMFDEHGKDEGGERKDENETDEHGKDDDGEKKDLPKDDEESDEDDKEDDDKKKEEEAKEKSEGSDEHDKDDDDEEEKSDDDENVQDGEEAGFLNGSSIFDTPFFNLEQVKKYFGHLDKALEYVFRQTMEEGIVLNGTYANTTEEEVEIDGKKYIVQKSLIQGPDNRSSIYVESLSSKSKLNNNAEDMEDTEEKIKTDT